MSEINDIEELAECSFPINLKLIQKYQWTEPSIKAKYKYGTYHKGSFSEFSNIDLKLITCKDKNCIPSKLQSYVYHWYHRYIPHPVIGRTEAMIRQYS